MDMERYLGLHWVYIFPTSAIKCTDEDNKYVTEYKGKKNNYLTNLFKMKPWINKYQGQENILLMFPN